jgi:hypothetical protein
MASRRATVALLLACAASLASATARAAPTAADRETARTLMDEGNDLREKGDLKAALKRFQGADAIMHVPTTAIAVARTQVALGLLVEARDTIAALRRMPAGPGEPAPFRDARSEADTLDASLAGRVPSLTITVTGAPEGAKPEVTVDGVAIPAAAVGLPRTVDPGHHVVVARASGASGTQEVDVAEGQTKPVQVTLAPDAASAPATAGSGEEAAPAPEAPPTVTKHGPTLLTWVGVGIAAAGVAAGTATGLMSMSTTNSLANECPNHVCPPQFHSDHDSAATLATVSTVSFVVAGVGAGVAIASLVLGHDESAPAAATTPTAALRPRVAPWIGLGAAGLRGEF